MPTTYSREADALRNLHELMTAVNSADQVAELLQTVVQGVVDILEYQIAIIYVLDDHEMLDVVAAAGDVEASQVMLGRRVALQTLALEFDVAEQWGALRFIPHELMPVGATTTWVPDIEPLDVPDAWHPLDALYALLRDPTGRLLGVLAVDLPVDRRRPGLLGRQVLEMYAVQAGLAIHQAQARSLLAERVALGDATRTILGSPAAWLEEDSIVNHSLKPLASGYRCDRLWLACFDAERPGASGATHPAELVAQLTGQTVAHLESIGRICWEAQRAVVVGGIGDTASQLLDRVGRRKSSALLDDLGGGQLLLTPLGSGSELLGALVLMREADAPPWTAIEAEGAFTLGREIGRSVIQARLYETQRRLNDELHELDRYKNELMGTITHELKAPLTVIDGHVELLEDSGAHEASVQAIRRGTRRLQHLVEDLLLLARVKDPHVPLQRVTVDLAEVIGELPDMFSMDVRQRGLTMTVPDRDAGVLAWGDRDEIARALLNVVGNAVKFTPDGGTVTLQLLHRGGTAEFSCTDTGIGIDRADQASLFEEFNRSSNPAAHEIPGTGLGLAIVKRIVERHDGTVSVTSERGRGSTFRIQLPAPPAM